MKFKDIKSKIKNLQLIGEGWRGEVYRGYLDNQELAFKVASEEQFIPNIQKEAQILKIVNQYGIGGKLVIAGEDFIAYEFIHGQPLKKVINKENAKALISQLLKQARILDKLGINKEEMHRPYTNVLVDDNLKVYLIDFERSKFSKNLQNVTQLIQFIIGEGSKYFPEFDKEKLIEAAKVYKKIKQKKTFRKYWIFFI
ncbi:serine/threonine protein kinase [Persephonella sp. KM09-Lau-8]|uniref:serine/threonine protein kinase n=1 Tax=Persephonella sp. KM09-Lau-8 TaxID=1158345 RepID=UPI0004968243|nr:serine/threonine protein kinase [Persephonella sp. KM09-Lau-8]